MCGLWLNVRACYPLSPHTATTQDTAIVGKIHPSRATHGKKRKRTEWKRKTVGALRITGRNDAEWLHGITRHLEPLATRWLHPRCCLDEVSFPAGTKNAKTDGGRGIEIERSGEESRCETLKAYGFYGVSWLALLWGVSSLIRVLLRSYIYFHGKKIFSAAANLDLL